MQSIDALIDKCLDQTASEADRGELELRLSDPEARVAFVAAQRLNACLEAVLKEETQVAQGRALVQSTTSGQIAARRSWREFAGVAAAILLLLGIGSWWRWHGDLPAPTPTNRIASNGTRPSDNAAVVAEISPAEAIAMFGLASAKAAK
jgi:hypothetical protein